MAKTDWNMYDVMRPEDFNQIGSEINEARSKAAAAETPTGAQSKIDVALESAKEYTDVAVSGIPAPPVTSVNSKTGAVTLGKGDVGLGNVENVKQTSKSEFDGHAGASTAHGATSDATPDRIAIRDANAQFKVGVPTDAAHVARKWDLDNVAGQLEDVLQKGTSDSEIFNLVTMVNEVDTRSVTIARTNGLISSVEEKSGSTVLRKTIFLRNASNKITQITQVCNGATVKYNINRDSSGTVTSVTKVVSWGG